MSSTARQGTEGWNYNAARSRLLEDVSSTAGQRRERVLESCQGTLVLGHELHGWTREKRKGTGKVPGHACPGSFQVVQYGRQETEFLLK